MRRFLLSAAVVGLSLALGGTAKAGDRGHSHGSFKGSFSSSSYHVKFGTKFSGGYYYKGRDHNHWSRRSWDDRYGCYRFYCPYTYCYYYWCEPDGCYYPWDYCPYGRYSW
jgi:hypothetical protein